MKNITVFTAFGVLRKVGDVKPYAKKKTQEESVLQNYSVNGHLFTLFGESQIQYHEPLVGKQVILAGRIETKQTDSGFRTSFLCDSLRLNYAEGEHISNE